MINMTTNEICEVNVPVPALTLDALALEQRELVLDMYQMLKAIDDSIGYHADLGNKTDNKLEPCMLNFFKETNAMLIDCLRTAENIKKNLGINQ